MPPTRRDFFAAVAASGCLPGLPKLSAVLTEPLSSPQATADSDAELDEATVKFWQEHVRQRVGSRGIGHHEVTPTTQRIPEFAIHTPEKGLRLAGEVEDKELLADGDVQIGVKVEAFKPSETDRDIFSNLKSGTFRIDLQQGQAPPNFWDALAWTAVAALKGDKGKLPPIGEAKFDLGAGWGTTKRIPLPAGGGFWTWNFFFQKNDSFLSKLSSALGAAEKFTGILGLPSIAVNAMHAFDGLFGYLQANSRSHWVFQSSNIPIVATQKARQQPEYTDNIPLRSGHYIIVPREHLKQLGDVMHDHDLQRGVLVPKGTDQYDVFEAADKALPEVTYLSLAVIVKPLPNGWCGQAISGS